MGPGQYPQYTRADFGLEAVGSSILIRHTSPNVKPNGEGEVPHGSGATDPWTQPTSRSCYATLTMWTLVRKTARTDEPATTEAASVQEPAAESPVETAQDEIADKAEEPNADKNKVKESALDPRKRRLELWNQSTSRNPGAAKRSVFVLPE